MVRRLLEALAVLCVALVLVGCDGQDAPEPAAQAAQPVSVPAQAQAPAAPAPTPFPTMQSDNPLMTEQKMMSLESQWALQAEMDGIGVVRTSEEEKNQIRAMLQQELAFNTVEFPLGSGTTSLIDVVKQAIDNGINMPSIPLSPDLIQSYSTGFNAAMGQAQSAATAEWFQAFHWTNHMASAGVNEFNLKEAGQIVYQIIKGATTDGVVMQNSDRFMFVAKLNIGGVTKIWATVIAQNGSPVTAFDTEKREIVKYATRVIATQGWTEITEGGLPESIRNSWLKGTPPIIRFVWWSLKFQLEMYARAAGLSIEQYMMNGGAILSHAPWLGLIVPACILESPVSPNRCGGSGDNKS